MKFFVSILLLFIVLLAACESEKKSKPIKPKIELSEEELIQRGSSIAMATFTALSTELQKAMKEGGVPNAIQYCNLAALPITDSLSVLNTAIIKRTSDKLRNPQNTATDDELNVLKDYRNKLEKKELLKPIIQTVDGEKIFYAPIILSNLCLNCHGSKAEMTDYQSIAQLYPKDQATGYKEGDLRGIWSIVLKQ